MKTLMERSINSCTLTVARLDYFDLGQIPADEGRGAGRTPSDTLVVQDSPERIDREQPDYPVIQSKPGITR